MVDSDQWWVIEFRERGSVFQAVRLETSIVNYGMAIRFKPPNPG